MTTIAPCSFIALLGFAISPDASAQSCATPTQIVAAGSAFSGDTCNNTNQLPFLANGAISAPGSQDIYHMSVGDGSGFVLSVVPDSGVDASVFICRNQCTTYATCVAAVDFGGAGFTETATLPPGVGDYYIVVQTAPAQCGSYNLSVSGFVKTTP
jgi:hypothetical protein